MEYSGHDAGLLLERWKELASSGGWRTCLLAEAGEYPVFALQNKRSAAGETGGLYVSAGVHGDECAPPWALLQWAENLPSLFDEIPVVIIPCFNPVGLIENTRLNEEGVDLNRNFQNQNLPLIASWQSFLEEKQFMIAVNLHEDYDATGIYLYEISKDGSPGDRFLTSCQDLIPRETASSVDGSEFENGLLIHDDKAEDLRQIVEDDLGGGMPEAIYLYLNHARNSFTFETPSEMDMLRRIAAHQRFLEAVSEYLTKG